ncbi:MAG: haloacid dehalogenase [Microbacterium sp. 69-7]|uniref:Haloacid dehalogenase n=1 Tax=Microbacterium hominis TaxID=162426 RepID=A0A0B4CV03_9MICO|nr:MULTISPECIES: HAD-IIB family hydrolase [Microbacterium]MDC7804470.1 HAD-IIB family hydrolase [Sphingomonas sp. BLCC-B65]AXA96350.1 haloacid dehalogenase [Microbacterium sp. PM5]EXJ51358.1 HAD family hydrolase [Microbacterium sp. MRS-1]KIC58171.1 haloacid dehalogenase [Microbacterium hominis]ODT21326.1 MAG: haloacid dehalogenase [Microbacterium sp. SCN 69-37]
MSGPRAEDRLPPTGAIEVVDAPKAAHLVDDLATDAENPAVATERLLIALDVDGTVLLEDETLSPGVVEAVAHAHRAGHEVMLATGRSWEGTRGIQHVLELAPEYAVCSNGAVIMKRVGGDFAEEGRYERFHVETFDPSEVVDLLRAHLPHAKYMVELADGERLYTERLDDWNLAHARRVDFAELVAQPVCRVVVVAPDETDEDFLALVERIGLTKVSYAVGWSAWLDIAPQGVDKSTALERVRTWLGVESERVLVMGDGRNDLGMFRWALDHGGRAIAMGQGPDEVRREAGEVTASVHAGGVADILREL